jgi:hypothetical protein
MKSRRMRWVRELAHIGKMKSAYKILARKPEGKRQIRRCMHAREDNTKMHLKE